MNTLRRLILVLALGDAALGGELYHEAWTDAMAPAGPGGPWSEAQAWVAWGGHHVWREGRGPDGPIQLGLPEGVRTVLRGEGEHWVLRGRGDLLRLEGQPAVWSGGLPWRAACPAGPDRAWLADREGLTLACFHAGASPEALARVGLAVMEEAWELQAGQDGSCWLQAGEDLWHVTPAGAEPRRRLPADWRDWAPWRDGVLGLDDAGRLHDLDEPGATGRLPRWEGGLSAPVLLDLRSVPGALWLQQDDGRWWRWLAGAGGPRRIVAARDEGECRWLPVAAGALLRQDRDTREWWTEEGAGWRPARRLERPPCLVDRQVRWSGDWRLDETGHVELCVPGAHRPLGTFPEARSFCRAGAGPLLLTAGGLTAFSEDGQVIGGWNGVGGLEAVSLEEILLLGGEEGLRTFWTDEEDPWLQHELALPGAGRLSASPLWAAVLAEGRLWLVDRAWPWTPVLAGSRPAPPGLADFLLAEDRLLLVAEDWAEAWSCREGVWQPLPPPPAALRGSWLCRRGADRLLALSRQGRLSQLRLVDNLPVAEEWCAWLPVAGRMDVARDSLRVTGQAGWLDWPLPALPAAPPAQPALRSPLLSGAGGRTDALRARATARGLRLDWDPLLGPDARLSLHDLLGRRLREVQGREGAACLDLRGLPRGLYLVEARWSDGRRQARVVTWTP